MDLEYTIYRTNTGSITSGNNLEVEEALKINIGLDDQDIGDIVRYDNIEKMVDGHEVNIITPKPKTADEYVGYHDDIVDALLETMFIITKIEESHPEVFNSKRVQKIMNTYDHYKKQQERYQQTNK